MSETTPFPPPPPPPIEQPAPRVNRISSILKKLRVLAVLTAVLSSLEILALLNQNKIVAALLDGTFSGSDSEVNAADEYVSLLSILSAVTLIGFIVAFMIWVYRSTKFLEGRHIRTEKSSKWAIGSFFIPIANYFLVYGTLKDLIASFGKLSPRISASRYRVLYVGWISLSIGSVLSRGDSYAPSDIEAFSLESYQTSLGFAVASAGLMIVSTISFAIAFKRLSADIASQLTH